MSLIWIYLGRGALDESGWKHLGGVFRRVRLDVPWGRFWILIAADFIFFEIWQSLCFILVHYSVLNGFPVPLCSLNSQDLALNSSPA